MIIKIISTILIGFAVFMGLKQGYALFTGKKEMAEMIPYLRHPLRRSTDRINSANMLHQFNQYLLLIIIILFLVMLANKVKVAFPIVLVLAGLILSFIPNMPDITIDPELIFVIFLPPLLYEAAWDTSWKDLWRWRRIVSSFAFLIVIITSFVIALASSAIIPGFTLALGFLLGGIISPPDAVSASAVIKYVKVPRRLSAIIEGESLLNDASSLIVFRFALIAVDTGHFIFHQAALSFVVVIAMGITTGIVIALLYYAVHRWMPTTPNIDIVLTLTAPYVMYIAAESLHFSGVLAVVSGGLFLSYWSHKFLSHRSRLRGGNVWSMLGFVLNGLVFLLIGLELPVIVGQLGNVGLRAAIGYGLIISAILIVARVLCGFGALLFTIFISRYITVEDSRPGWKAPLIFGWTGMRGVVSLAAALSIPFQLSNGQPFPQRNLILFVTFVVILMTLVVQGLSLPFVIRWVNMEDPDIALTPEEQENLIRVELSQVALDLLDQPENRATPSDLADQLRVRFEKDRYHAELSNGPELNDFQQLYLQLLDRQREALHLMNKRKDIHNEIVRKYEGMLDLEEEKLRMRFEGAE